jgi:hypothetical protein
VILFILFLHLAVPLGSVRGTPGYRGNPVGNQCFRVRGRVSLCLDTGHMIKLYDEVAVRSLGKMRDLVACTSGEIISGMK